MMVLLLTGLALADGPFSPEGIYEFARYLYGQGEYLRAAGEFQRYLFLGRPPAGRRDSVLLRIGICYRKVGKFGKALRYFGKVGGSLRDEARYQAGLCYIYSGNYDTVALWNCTGPKLRTLIFAARLLDGRWKEARKIVPREGRWGDILRMGMNLPHRSPVLAGLLSGLVPGAGKIYCGRTWDGIYSLVTIGTFAWQSYSGFERDGRNSLKGWAFGAAAVIFYLGNIYGSAAAAKIYNLERWESFKNAVLDMLGD